MHDNESNEGLFNINEQIGNTPIEEYRLFINDKPHSVRLKVEGENPFGSIKDRTASFLLEDAERKGLITAETVIVESTSGNLGIALANICRLKNYKFIAVVDPKTTAENLARLKAAGAEIELVEEMDEMGGYLLNRLRRVAELCGRNENYVSLNQYGNPANPHAHYSTTAPEIFRQMRGEVDTVFLPVSTGGTLSGISRFFRRISPSTIIVAVDAVGSVAVAGPPGPRRLTGIGSSRRSEFISSDLYDELILVSDAEAFDCCNTLFNATGRKVGGSSGAVIAACIKYLAKSRKSPSRFVCLCADRGENYDSSIYNNQWLEANGFAGRSVETLPNYWFSSLPASTHTARGQLLSRV